MKTAVVILYLIIALQLAMVPVAVFFGHAALRGAIDGILEVCDRRYVVKVPL